MQKIVIVDDEPGIVDVLKRFLKKGGYDITIFTDAEQALGFVRSNFKIDLLIVDLKMPKVSGVFIIQEGAKKNIPFIIISSGIGIKVDEDLNDLGFDVTEIFRKPFDLYKLLEAVKKKLEPPPAPESPKQ